MSSMQCAPERRFCVCSSSFDSSERKRNRPVGVTLSAKEAQLEWKEPTLSHSCIRLDVDNCTDDIALAAVSFDSRVCEELRMKSFSVAVDEPPPESPEASPALPLLVAEVAAAPAAAPAATDGGGLEAMAGLAPGFGLTCVGAA